MSPELPQPAPRKGESAAFWLNAIWRRRRMIGAVALGLSAMDVGVALMLPRIYRAESLLQIEDRDNKLVDVQAFAAPVLADGGVIKSQVDVIRAPRLALEVIGRQHLLETKEFRDAVAPLHYRALSALVGLLPAQMAADLPEDVRRIVAEPWVATTEQDRRKREEDAVRFFEKRLEVDANMQGRTIRIRFNSERPELAAAVTNAMAQAYVDDQINYKLETIRRTNSWLTEQIERLRLKARESEDRLNEFRRANGLGTDLAPGFTQQQLSELNTAFTTASAQLAQSTARLREAETAARTGKLDAYNDALASPTIHDLRRQEAEVSRTIAELSSVFNDNDPGLVRSRAQLADIHRRVDAELQRMLVGLRGEVEVARARRDEIERRIDTFRAQTNEKEPVNVEAAMLAREAQVNRSVFAAVVKKAEETNAVDGLQRPDSRIVSEARIPGHHSSPKLTLVALVGGLLSLLLGIALAALLEHINTAVNSLSQGERLLGFSGAGWVPRVRASSGQFVHDLPLDSPYSPYSEALRSIAVTLKAFFRRHRTVILVTSATPREGKTTFALSYGRSLALAGQNCLVIDCDLRRQAVSTLMSGYGRAGLADVVSGRVTLEDAVQHDQSSRLAFLSAGEQADDPLAILDNPDFGKTLAAARERYDVIVLDAPPLLAVSDAVMMAQYADLTLMVVSWQKTPARAVTDAIRQLRLAGATAISFILSQVDVSALGPGDMESYSLGYGRPALPPPAWQQDAPQ